MTRGYIDSASLYAVSMIFRHRRPGDAYEWAWQSALEVTCTLVQIPHIDLAPAPAWEGAASGPYGLLTDRIAAIVPRAEIDAGIRKPALGYTRQRVSRAPARIATGYNTLRLEPNFSAWLDEYVAYAWPEHANRLSGLFNPEFVPEISKVLDVDQELLRDLLLQGRDPSRVEYFSRHMPDTDDFRLMKDAFVVSTLMRGIYHDKVAQLGGYQIMHHPLREPVLAEASTDDRVEIGVTNTQEMFARMILGSAFAERTQQARIETWVENVSKARDASQRQMLDLRDKNYDERALAAAMDAARTADIRAHPKYVEWTLDMGPSLGLGVLTSFVLISWLGFAVGTAGTIASRTGSIGKRAAQVVYRRDGRLRDLSRLFPGRVRRVWTRNS
jgi:hypothetical protein